MSSCAIAPMRAVRPQVSRSGTGLADPLSLRPLGRPCFNMSNRAFKLKLLLASELFSANVQHHF